MLTKSKIRGLLSDSISGEWGTEPASPEEGVFVIRTANFFNNGRIDFNNLVKRNIPQHKVLQKRLKTGDVLIEKSGGSPIQPVGRVTYFSESGGEIFLANNFITVLRPDTEKVHPLYLFYLLHRNHQIGKTLKFQNKTTGILNLKLDQYLDSEIEYESDTHDQLRIAALLTRAEGLIAQRKESLRLLDELVKGAFLEMFGEIDEDNIIDLVSVCNSEDDIKCGPFGTQLNKSEYQKEGVPLWNITDVNLHFKTLPKEFLSKSKAKQLQAYSLISNDIVMTRKATVGNASLYPPTLPDGVMHSDLLRIRINPKLINPVFLLYQLKISQFIDNQIRKISQGAITKGINVTKLKALKIHSPPLHLQTHFAALVERVESLKKHYTDSLRELEQLYGSLSRRAFRGELDLGDVYETSEIS